MANDNIFQQYLTPPKSVMDYTAELDQADARRNALQQNALELAAGRQKFNDYQREREGENHLSRLVAAGGTPDQVAAGLAQAGYGKQALAYTKQQQDLAKAQADTALLGAQTGKLTSETGKIDYDQREAKRQKAISDIAAFTDPQQAIASLKLHVEAGDVDPAQGQLIMQTIPQNPADFPKWQIGMLQRIMAAKEAAGQIAPDANTVANNNTSIKTAGIAASTAANRLAFDKQQAATNQDDVMDPLAVRLTAQQYLAGDTGALQNFGRGAQGAKNLNAVRLEITKQANAAGLNGADIAAKVAEFGGLKAGQRTAGTRSANIEIAANEAAQLAPLALEASAKVARSSFVPFGKLEVMFNTNTNNPDMRQFAMANTALVNAYGQVMSRGGAATDSDKAHARDLLATTFDQPSYAAAVAQLQAEIRAAQKAPQQVRKDLSNATSGRTEHAAAATDIHAQADAILKGK